MKYAVSSGENFNMLARMSGGVIVPITIADTCCAPTSNEVPSGSLSSRPCTIKGVLVPADWLGADLSTTAVSMLELFSR